MLSTDWHKRIRPLKKLDSVKLSGRMIRRALKAGAGIGGRRIRIWRREFHPRIFPKYYEGYLL